MDSSELYQNTDCTFYDKDDLQTLTSVAVK